MTRPDRPDDVPPDTEWISPGYHGTEAAAREHGEPKEPAPEPVEEEGE